MAYVSRSAGLVATALPAGDRVYPGSIAVAPRGVLVIGNRDGRAYLWDETTGALIRSVHDPDGAVTRWRST